MATQDAPDPAPIVSRVSMRTAYAYALAFLAFAAILSPAAGARRLQQDSATINDNDILNFALNLEVSKQLMCWQALLLLLLRLLRY